jgi:hypothetical protein
MDTQSKVFQIRICRMHLGWRDGGTINLLTVGKTGLDGGLRGWADGGLRGWQMVAGVVGQIVAGVVDVVYCSVVG